MKRVLNNGLVAGIAATVVVVGCTSMYYDGEGGGGGSSGSGQADFLISGTTSSFFRAIQIDPRSEDSAGPQFVDVGDLDGDGRLDLVSGWNESQPIQMHFQDVDESGNIVFATVPLAGTTPIARIGGLKVADMDGDGNQDIVVLVKDTGTVAVCDPSRPDCDPNDNNGVVENATMGEIIIFYAPNNPRAATWAPLRLVQSQLAGLKVDGELPEEGGYTALEIGDVDGINGVDIVVALNSGEGEAKMNSIDFYPNPGVGRHRDAGSWDRTVIWWDLPKVKDCKLLDVDRDGDVDVVCTYPDARSSNVQWLVNPLDGGNPNEILQEWGWPAPIGQVHTHADTLTLGDVDQDGITDVVVRSTQGRIVQWFKGPAFPSFDFIRTPWQVYTLAEFLDRDPGAVALGDLDGDGTMDAAIGAQGALAWFESSRASTVFDQWLESIIIDDSPPDNDGGGDASGTDQLLQQLLTDQQAQDEPDLSTIINAVLVVDIDDDGDQDIIATLDRQGMSGLTNDALVWFINNRAN